MYSGVRTHYDAYGIQRMTLAGNIISGRIDVT